MAPGRLDSRDADSLKPPVQRLLTRIDELLAQNKALLARIAELEAKLGQPPKTPTNSSLPPSRGQKANASAPPREKKGRKGRPGVARALCPMRDAQYAIDAGDRIFAPAFKRFLKDACAVGRRRERLADATIKAHACRLQRELDRLLALKPTQADGRHLREAILLDARDKLLTFLSRRDVEPTNNASEQALRSSVIFRKVTNGFRSAWGAKVYADIRSVVATARIAGRTALAAINKALAPPANSAAAA